MHRIFEQRILHAVISQTVKLVACSKVYREI